MLNIIKKLLSILNARERAAIAPLVAMMVVGGLLESLSVTLVIPLITGIMDTDLLTSGIMGSLLRTVFGPHDGRGYLVMLLLAMIVVFIAKNAFLVWRTYEQNKATGKIRARVQKRLLHYYLTRPYSYFLNAESGEVLGTVSVDSDGVYMVAGNVLGLLTSLCIAAIMTLVVFAVHPQITSILAAALLVEYVVILKVVRPSMHRHGENSRASAHRNSGLVVEIMRGIKSIKVADREPSFERRYARDADSLARARVIEQSLYAMPHRFIEAVTVSVLLVYLLVMLSAGADISQLVPVLSAFVLASSRILPCVSGISSSVSNSHYYEPGLDHVIEIDSLLKKEEAERTKAATNDDGVPATFSREIRMEGICFTYPSGDEPVLHHVDAVIPCKSSVGIVGPSGAGKTTLVDVLLGLLESQQGTITMDGSSVDVTSPAWRAKFAYIPQNVFMLTGTVRDNVVFGWDEQVTPDTDARIWEALETAQLADFVHTLKDGLDSEIGEAGIRLSGGQIQRLGIARALYTDAPILVFDEATSALDNDTENALMQAINHLHGTKTLITIAHRLSTIENCDIVYRVEGGTVSEEPVGGGYAKPGEWALGDELN